MGTPNCPKQNNFRIAGYFLSLFFVGKCLSVLPTTTFSTHINEYLELDRGHEAAHFRTLWKLISFIRKLIVDTKKPTAKLSLNTTKPTQNKGGCRSSPSPTTAASRVSRTTGSSPAARTRNVRAEKFKSL